ncbi:MAG: 5'-deoxynucleotidase [Oscillospiraceae bacterium]|jgi:5'-deoxynucleotidase|nr:5'-deoxynucleotidase [Oscillospiraceae bacterium]
MTHSFFALISRLRNIARWALMRNSLSENVQEHSHMTAVLAHALAVIRRDVYQIPCDPGAAAAAALFHDASEILTGDMPTPIKYLNREITAAYKDAERQAQNRLLATLPELLRGAYRPLLDGGESEDTRALVHAADKLAAYIKCLEEERAGNREFRQAGKQTRERLEALGIPEVQYFLDNFMPAFELSLDELEM